ncbi:hypothetical protein ACQK5W_04045 [Pantoea sp. FN060301]|uniref:hypothetical protein n=1 Tax=Pantoea sp. FN060301 TaxID=3420380 RepID=UPI003D17FB2C
MWQLSKGPMTGTELGRILKMPVQEVHNQMRWQLRETQTASFSAGEWEIDSEGNRDRTYTLKSRPRRIIPRAGKTITISTKAFGMRGDDARQKNIIAAQRRARLHKAGLWITEL